MEKDYQSKKVMKSEKDHFNNKSSINHCGTEHQKK